MARPVYILCSEAGVEDKATGLISHFNVIDKLELREVLSGPSDGVAVINMIRLSVVAVWAGDPEDEGGRVYEFENRLYLPPDGRKVTANEGTFRFDNFRRRFTVNVIDLPIQDAGILRAESRIRPQGAEEWLIQGYDILVVVVPSGPKAKGEA